MKTKDDRVVLAFIIVAALLYFWFYCWAARQTIRGNSVRDLIAFRHFRKGIRENPTRPGWDNAFTLTFASSEDENRFVADNAGMLCRRAMFICIATGVIVIGHFWLTATAEGPELMYMAAGCVTLLLAAFMLFQTTLNSPNFSSLSYMEIIVVAWLAVVILLSHIFFLPKESGRRTSNELTFAAAITLLVHTLCVHTPLRFPKMLVLCGSIPFFFWSYSHSFQEEADVNQTNKTTVVLIMVVAGALLSKHTIERQQRLAWMTAYNAYKTLRTVEEERELQTCETLIQKTKAALGKVNQALDVMSTFPDMLPRDVLKVVHTARANADFAGRSLQRADVLFNVTAEQALNGKEYAHRDDLRDFINSTKGHRLPIRNSSNAGPSVSTRRSQRPSNFIKEKQIVSNSVRVVSDIEMCAGIGKDYGFSALQLSRDTRGFALVFASEHVFVRGQVLETANMDRVSFRHWVREIRQRYQNVAYHNEAHGAQVLCLSAYLSQRSGWRQKADYMQVAALLLACVAHDVGHFGRNNMFCTKMEHTVAKIWNDRSVLENMHTALAFNCMRGPADIMESLDNEQEVSMRKNIIRFILSTDIKDHHSSLARLNARMEAGHFLELVDNSLGEDLHAKFEEDVLLAGETLIKASDIGHGLMPWSPHREWSYRVTSEFFAQGDEERMLGCPCSPLCDRRAQNNFAGSQSFFIDVFSTALMKAVLKFSDERGAGGIKMALATGRNNMERWKEEDILELRTLDECTLVDVFGKGADAPIFPYEYDKGKLDMQPLSPEENLRELAMQDFVRSMVSIPVCDVISGDLTRYGMSKTKSGCLMGSVSHP